jgi:uncharacterized protein YggU (UPF0235/DUF167 family)
VSGLEGLALRPEADGRACVLELRVQPGASRAGLALTAQGRLVARVCAPPAQGRANAELLVLLARGRELGPSALELKAGSRGRNKRLRVPLAPGSVRERLARRLGSGRD